MNKSSNNWLNLNFAALTCPEVLANCNPIIPFPLLIPAAPKFNMQEDTKPKIKEDLAVHPKKIKEVELWLQQNVLQKKSTAPVLLITGPAGSGKTETLKILCKIMRVQLREWINPIDKGSIYSVSETQSSRFIEFFMQSKYCSLCEDETVKRVVLVDDFPNFLIHTPSEFPGILEKIVSINFPVVFICTDASSYKLDLAQKLFPADIKQKFKITTINFNSCCITLVRNALKRVQKFIENRPGYIVPNEDVLERIIASSLGDIRTAVQQYHMACIKAPVSNVRVPMPKFLPRTASAQIPAPRGRALKRRYPSPLRSMHFADEKLGLFRAVGRVLNPKRFEENGRLRVQDTYASILEEFRENPGIFSAYLHANYFNCFANFDDVQKAADTFSQLQTYLDNWDERHDMAAHALFLAVFGVMVLNTETVKKWNPIRGPVKTQEKKCQALGLRKFHRLDAMYLDIIKGENKYYIYKT